MTLEQVVRVAGVLRRLSDDEWDVLVGIVEHGDDAADPVLLGRACDALADAAELVRQDHRVPVRLVTQCAESRQQDGK